jgi:DNA-directed RNA polymerase subunit H (RpoH/RPB5)
MNNNKKYITNAINTISEMIIDRNVLFNPNKYIFEDVYNNFNPGMFYHFVIDDVEIIFDFNKNLKIPNYTSHFQDNKNIYILVLDRKNLNQIESTKLYNLVGKDKFEKIEVFDIKELQFNISRHVLVPKHEKIDNGHSILSQYNLSNPTQLPIILHTDPMAKYLGLKPGDYVKITRVSQVSGIHIIYRYCI